MQPGGAKQFADVDRPIAFGSRQEGQFVGLLVDREFCGIIHFF